MNERIQELAEQAGLESFYVEYSPWQVEFEKFAELIVRECAGVELYWLGEQDRKSLAEKIKQHFGIEE